MSVQERIDHLLKAITDCQNQIEPLQNRIVEYSDRLRELREIRDAEWIASLDPSALIDYEKILTGEDMSQAFRDYRSKLFAGTGVVVEGCWPDTRQAGVQVELYRGSRAKTKLTFETLAPFLPYIKPREVLDGFWKVIRLFERTLSYKGVWEIQTKGDSIVDEFILTCNLYEDRKFNSLWECLLYCEKHHYYKDERPD